jgi:hypothetical protein
MRRNGMAQFGLSMCFSAHNGNAAIPTVADDTPSPDESSAKTQIDVCQEIAKSYPHAPKLVCRPHSS